MAWVRSWYGPALFGVLVYFSIEGFGRSDDYNRYVAAYATTAAAAFLVVALFQGERPAASPVVLWLLVALASSIAVSIWLAPSTYWAVNRLHLYYGVMLLGIGVYLTQKSEGAAAVRRFMIVVAVIHAIVLVDVIFLLVSLPPEEARRVTRLPHFANIRHFAYLGFLASCCSTAVYIGTRRLQSSAFLLTVAGLFGIVLLGARGALLAWLLFCAVVALCVQQRARFIAFCVLAVSAAATLVWGLAEAGFLHGPSLFRRFEDGVQSAFHVMDRVSVWGDSARAILDRPWFGFGPDAYIHSRCCNPTLAQPHNFVLQYLLEFGIVGCTILAALAWVLVRERWSAVARPDRLLGRPELAGLAALLVGFLAYSSIDGLLYHAIPLVHFAVFVALLLSTLVSAECRGWDSAVEKG